jgi:hypothetical protein
VRNAVSYSTEFVEGGVIHVGTGVVDGAEIIAAAIEEHRLEDRARRLRFGLVDLTDVTDLQVTSEHVRRIALENLTLAKLTPGAVVAVAAPSDVAFGMARMWQTFASRTGWQILIVRSKAAATEWLRGRLGRDI